MTLRGRGPLVVGLAGAALVVLMVAGLILPRAAQVRARQHEVEEARGEQASLTVQLEQLRAIAAGAPADRRRLAQLERAVPDTADLSDVVRMLNDLAGRSDLDFITVAPATPSYAAGSPVSVVATQITVDGRYFALDDFVRRLETSGRVSKLTTISVTEGPGGVPQLQANLTAEFYTTDASAGPGSDPGHTAAIPAAAAPAEGA